MRIRPANRRPILFGAALLVTLVATWWAASVEEQASVAAGKRVVLPTVGGGRAAVSALRPGALAVRRTPWPDEGTKLIPPPPPPPVAQAPAPEPPPLPFRFVGALEVHGQRAVVLLEGEEVRILRGGERVDERYRVEEVTPTRVEFTYLPLRKRQFLEIANHDSIQ